MLIIPLEKSINWRKPPFVTLLLIIINSLVLLISNAQDEKIFKSSINYYLSTELAKIELPPYIETQPNIIRNFNNTDLIGMIKNNQANEDITVHVLMAMESDQSFMKKLHKNEIITEQNKDYSEWKTARTKFESIMQSSMSARYRFVPSEHKPITFLTHQFLHAGYDHLIGNMLFLFLIGFALETALGSLLYLVCYLISGLGAVTLFWLVYSSSDIGLVGASGAISGLMGMYAGVFGLRKIRFFYSLLFYFDYIKAPALIMLPLWIMNEIYQLFFTTGSNVAYVAHIGGLLTGGIISFAIKQYFTEQIDTHYLDESDQHDEKDSQYEQGMKLLGELKIPQAQYIFSKLYAQYPNDLDILMQYYKTLKYTPELKEYHAIAMKIFEIADMSNIKQVINVFKDYIKLHQRAELPSRLLIKLAMLFSKNNNYTEAETIIKNLLQKSTETDGLDQALFGLATAWKRSGNSEKYIMCLNLLAENYPMQAVGINAHKLLKEMGN